ncbi:MAG: hypothetical protein JXR83_21895 [Deltaproteobacteria bacterium]|nr:hypothetical protein [Deltaproteobacteria bacterium]
MSEKQGFGSKLVSLFVTTEEEEAAKAASDPAAKGAGSVDDLLKRYGADGSAAAPAGPAPAAAAAIASAKIAPSAAGELPLDRIFSAAGIGAEAQGHVSKAMELLKSLPAETPLNVKRQIVETSLKAFGFPIAQLVEAAGKESEALDAYLQIQAGDTSKVLADSDQRIGQLQAEIAQLEQKKKTAVEQQNQATAQTVQAKGKIKEVLDFFGAAAPAAAPPAPAAPAGK